MKNEVILTAKTVEEAMRLARAQYGSADNELSFEILEMPKKGFLGIGAAPAKIKVTITRVLEDVDLSDLVSEIRNMKLTTDRDGGEEERKPKPQPKPAQPAAQPKEKPQQKSAQPAAQQPKAQQQKPAQSAAQPKVQQQKSAQSAAQPKAQPQQKPAQPTAQQPKVQQQKPAQPAAQPKAQPQQKPAQPVVQAAGTDLNENELPAALRRPAPRPAEQKKKKPKSAPRTPDGRGGEEKKRDLLSAVMEIRETAPQPRAEAEPQETAQPSAPQPEVTGERLAETEPVPAPSVPAPAAEAEPEAKPEFVTVEEMEYALAFTQKLLDNMHLDAHAVPGGAPEGQEVPEGMTAARICVVGEDTGILIGHHGETLDAIQYLMNLSASRRSGAGKREFVKILLDIGNYREKREETLRALARRMSARAIRYKRNVVLEPMNPYERRIIHSEIHGIENVSTHSVGSDENRKIVITYEGEDRVPRAPRAQKPGDRRRPPRTSASSAVEKENAADKVDKMERKERRPKPARAKSIDEIRIDLSEASSETFGSVLVDEGVETGDDPIEKIAAAEEAAEENLREF
ncbi:MAG: RNA-binding cell elongation regulator Jag/EloR [Eubacteriales bacterium]